MQLHTLEIEEDVLSACSAQSVLQHFYDAGLVAISGLYTPQQITQLEMAFQKALEQHIQAHGGLEQLNKRAFGKNHIGFFPPLVPPFSNVEFVAHPHLIPLLESLLGADFICCFYHTNTAYPGSEFQPVHRDHPPLFGTSLPVPHPPTHMVLNVPLCDFTEENGSTEVWPGTHLIVDSPAQATVSLETRAAAMPSIRMNVPAGTAVLRDLRTWHRGMPNRSARPRAMLAIVYQRACTHAEPVVIPKTTWDSWPQRVRQIFRRNHVE
ncbi:phytanoyl-CoA dioxygenase family protein [Chthonomonas calidirosea]|uniref:phytanoyl-CoA dioxygenase family protein n=1 Tax=Chthonomonas calidirosea TaxID=454171 RepID=UPI0006EC5E05|nr:phytanoyl-CoA dioxygenase family protein [Chthonomonas calidirosea]CEK14639.1 protein involved in biosynthesis of mitomycin antibiotics/polyketide fumonisin [Chthonomonas calidirosea]